MPASRSPTGMEAIGARMTTGTDGGMIVPSEPPPQMVPAISERW